jgi:rhodanese-related sulfurtransferase
MPHRYVSKKILGGLLAILLAAAGLAAAPMAAIPGAKVAVPGGSYVNIDPSSLREMLKAKDFLFVNVHIPYQGEIKGTDAFIPFDRTSESLKLYPADRGARIVLYCRSGRMSELAARDLVRAGFTNVANLDGGMNAWAASGLPLEDRKR